MTKNFIAKKDKAKNYSQIQTLKFSQTKNPMQKIFSWKMEAQKFQSITFSQKNFPSQNRKIFRQQKIHRQKNIATKNPRKKFYKKTAHQILERIKLFPKKIFRQKILRRHTWKILEKKIPDQKNSYLKPRQKKSMPKINHPPFHAKLFPKKNSSHPKTVTKKLIKKSDTKNGLKKFSRTSWWSTHKTFSQARMRTIPSVPLTQTTWPKIYHCTYQPIKTITQEITIQYHIILIYFKSYFYFSWFCNCSDMIEHLHTQKHLLQ